MYNLAPEEIKTLKRKKYKEKFTEQKIIIKKNQIQISNLAQVRSEEHKFIDYN